MRSINLSVTAAGLLALCATAAQASSFTSGNLVVFQAGDGSTLANNSAFSIIELTKSAAQPSPAQSFPISTSNGLWCSATATSTGYLSLSESRGSVQFAGHTARGAASAPFPNANTVTARGVGSLDNSGTYSLLAAYTGVSGNQARSGGLMNNSDLYISDQAGFYANGGGPTAALAANIRNVRSFGGTLFVMQQSSVVSTIVVSAVGGNPAAPTITGLAGLTNNNTAQDFYMVSSAADGVFDLLYLTTTTGISKFQLSSGAWVARGTATVSGGLFGLAAEVDATGAGIDLYVTSGGGAGNANSVRRFIDSAAPSGNLTIDAGTTLFTTPSNTTLKGIELAPALIPTPGSAALMVVGLACVRRRRSN